MSTLGDIASRAANGAYGEDSHVIGKAVGILIAANVDKGWGPFICGVLGKKGEDGLHDGYLVCPSYGADIACTAAFMRPANKVETA